MGEGLDTVQRDSSPAPLGARRWRYGFLFLVLAALAALLLQTYLATGNNREDYAGRWEYRYGDSPADSQGHLLWALPNDTSDCSSS